MLMCSWIRFVRILWSNFASVFIREIGQKLSFFVGSLCALGIRVTVGSENELGSVPYVSILWNSLGSIGMRTFLKVCWNHVLIPSGSGLCLVGDY